jgi:hypothetical protein
MSIRAGLAIVAAIAIAACTSTPPDGGGASGFKRPACKPGSDCATPVSATFCQIPEPEEISVEGGAIDLVWNLDPGVLGYTFVGKGIVIPQNEDPYNEFGPPRVTGNTVTIRDANTHVGKHKYTITIRNHFKDCKELDPTIVNKG